MAPSRAVRSFAITLAIAITIIGPQASGFTINRTNNTTLSTTETHSTDLSSGKSFQLQEKEDLRKLNNTNNSKDEVSNKTTKSSTNETSTEIVETTPAVKIGKTLSMSQTTIEVRSTTENIKIPTISSDTVEVFDSLEDVTKHKDSNENAENSRRSSIKLNQIDLEAVLSLEKQKTRAATENSSETIVSTELTTVTDQIATESNAIEDYSTRKSIMLSSDKSTTILQDSDSTFETITESVIFDESSILDTFPIVEEMNSSTSEKPTTEFSHTTSETSLLSTISNDDSSIPTEVFSTFSDTNITEITTEVPNIKTIEPSWRKYTTIERKRVTSSEDAFQTGRTEDDTMKTETSNTNVNFEKFFNLTPIPTKLNTISNLSQSSASSEIISVETEKTTVAIESLNTVDSTEAKRTGTVQTKRAGYLDNSEKASTPLDIAFINARNKDSDTETHKAVDDSELTDTESPYFKKVSGSESQSQLAEDAIQEELMKEEALLNHQENVKRYRDEQTETKGVKPLGTTPSISVDDFLNVQPISPERTKTTLYTVSPNYKPMKKIDVQPSKPFVRDPDDNSWRNESISSLGIVFKPKNSSISFKEVLKNKTQSELNNLQEKDSKSDMPDLRLRLEKIAEVRKTKKKKMNKDGEVVYADYEEGNSGEGSTPKPESIFSSVNAAEMSKLTVSPNSQVSAELTTPMSNWLELEANKTKHMSTQALFNSLGLDPNPLTTKKPKNFFNIAEYYDTTDEYDADYVTMSKLDLKKFTVSRTTPHPVTYSVGLMPTRPMGPHFPDRRPTVQYFPPRTPQRVNVNNLDKDFERKINLFTFKDPPRIEPRPPFVTVPPVPIATMQPEPEMGPPIRPGIRPEMRPVTKPDIEPNMRPTLKPIDFAINTPPNLSKSYYLTNAPRTTDETFVIHDGSLHRGSYVIKHYRDFLNAAAKDNDDERTSAFLPFQTRTDPPQETTVSVAGTEKSTKSKEEDYDYEMQFRKDVLNRFVDNFNQNSERFKVDFPILYNNSIVHRKVDENGQGVASSRAFLKRLYNSEGTVTKANFVPKKPCEPNCDMTVELSPAYELHYYVPEQEEREPAEVRAAQAPLRFAL